MKPTETWKDAEARFERLKVDIDTLETELSKMSESYLAGDDTVGDIQSRIRSMEDRAGGAILRFMRGER